MGRQKTEKRWSFLKKKRKSVLNIHWKDWCWSWNSNPLATWCEEQTHWKRPWCWERLKAEEGDDRGWDGRMVSPTQWTWGWASSGSWWLTGRPGVLLSMGSQRVRHHWVTDLNWVKSRHTRILDWERWRKTAVLKLYIHSGREWNWSPTLVLNKNQLQILAMQAKQGGCHKLQRIIL